MSSPRHEDALVQALAMLPPVVPNQTRADRLRARCRARLERPPHRMLADLEPKLVGALGAMYAWQIVKMVVR
jgi:hypothetical protein